ncbi:MAG: type II toxin-antitoxin system PemK/MazF family toxin [Peptococcaceae bacterium]|nr:type II toxin-antitoxin system PemK/MazF family toxin [Peptococcaceae bacterium]
MAGDAVAPGDVLLINLPSHSPKGHGQEGSRPVFVVGVPTEPARYPVVIVVPLTTQSGPWAKKNPAMYLAAPFESFILFLPLFC